MNLTASHVPSCVPTVGFELRQPAAAPLEAADALRRPNLERITIVDPTSGMCRSTCVPASAVVPTFTQVEAQAHEPATHAVLAPTMTAPSADTEPAPALLAMPRLINITVVDPASGACHQTWVPSTAVVPTFSQLS